MQKNNIHISSNTFWVIKLLLDPSMKKKTCASHRGFSLPSFETRSALKLLQVEHFHKMITHLHTMKFHLRSWYVLWSMQLVSCPVKLDRVDVVLLCLAQPTQKESHSAGYTCIVNVVVFQIGCYSCKAPTRESIAPRKKLFLAKHAVTQNL